MAWSLAALGALALVVTKGIAWGFGFLAGAVMSALSFELLHRFALAVGAGRKPENWKLTLAGGRYLVIGGVLYVMMKSFELNLVAVVCGLLVTAAAVLAEILYEFIHGT